MEPTFCYTNSKIASTTRIAKLLELSLCIVTMADCGSLKLSIDVYVFMPDFLASIGIKIVFEVILGQNVHKLLHGIFK